jgi:hypothetical protein
MRVLAAVELRAAPFHAGIGGAFEEISAVHPTREALQVVHGEDHRLVDEAVDHQPVLGRVDLGNAAVMALEAEAGGRDDTVEFMQRREVDRGLAAGGEPFDIPPHDVLLELRGRSIGPRLHPVAQRAGPVLHIRDERIGSSRRSRDSCRPAAGKTRSPQPRRGQEPAPVQSRHAGLPVR